MKINLANARKGIGLSKPHLYPTYYPKSGRYYLRVSSAAPAIKNRTFNREAWNLAHAYSRAHNYRVWEAKQNEIQS